MITAKQAHQMSPAQRKQAIQQVQAALQRDKNNIAAILSGAALYHAARAVPQAVMLLQRAHELKPKDPMILQWLAVASAEIRDFATSKSASEKLVTLAPDNAENWQVRGRVLESSGDTSLALEAFEHELTMRPPHAELYLQIANCYTYLGDHVTAVENYLKAIELDPTHGLALYGYSTLHKFSKDDVEDYIAKIDAAIPANQHLPAYNTSAVYYGGGKALEDVGKYDEAFAYYEKANEFRKPDNTNDLEKPFIENKEAFNQSIIDKTTNPKQIWGDPKSSPIFVIGMPRSGTTLVESIAAAHSTITPSGEMPFMEDLTRQIRQRHAKQHGFRQMILHLQKDEIKQIGEAYLSGVETFSGVKDHFTDKLPHNFMNVGLIYTLFPNARIIHCKRNPMDTCASIYTNGMTPAHNYYKSSQTTLGQYYNHYLGLMDYWHELYPGKILDIYYEDVVANTELNSRKIIEYLGLDWEDAVLDRAGSQKAVRTLSAWQVRQPIYASSQGKWKRYEKQLAPLKAALGDTLDAYDLELKKLDQDS